MNTSNFLMHTIRCTRAHAYIPTVFTVALRFYTYEQQEGAQVSICTALLDQHKTFLHLCADPLTFSSSILPSLQENCSPSFVVKSWLL